MTLISRITLNNTYFCSMTLQNFNISHLTLHTSKGEGVDEKGDKN